MERTVDDTNVFSRWFNEAEEIERLEDQDDSDGETIHASESYTDSEQSADGGLLRWVGLYVPIWAKTKLQSGTQIFKGIQELGGTILLLIFQE